jgi:Fibronectin type III domain
MNGFRPAWPALKPFFGGSMRKAERGFGSRRIVAALYTGSLAIALAGCGGADGSSSTGTNSPFAAAATAAPAGTTTTGTSNSGSSSTSTTNTTSASGATSAPTATASSSSVTLGWQAPTQNTDGSPITDLAGYKIHYGTASDDYTQTVELNNAGLSRYVVDNLPSGTYYFAVTAYNSKGVESNMSAEVSTKVNN